MRRWLPRSRPLSIAPLSIAPLSIAPLSIAPLSIALLVVACAAEVEGPAVPSVYEECAFTAQHISVCPDRAACEVTLWSLNHPGPTRGICTVECSLDEDCPPLEGYAPVCETFVRGRRCAIPCASDADCPFANQCVTVERLNGERLGLCAGGDT